MADQQAELIGDDDVAFRLELTPRELKVTHTALRAMLNDFGHDEHDVAECIRSVLRKLPPSNSIEGIDLHLPRRRRRL